MREHRLRIGDREVTLVAGPAGWGEASPLPGYACGDGASRRAAEESARDGWPAALRDTVPVNALVDDVPVDPGALAGFPAVKVKVGRMDPRDDLDLVAAVRDAVGPSVALRVDANGAWEVEQAVHAIDALAPIGLELVEEPVHGVAAIREVRARVAVRIAIDETAAHEGALDAGAAHAVCLKISRCGGISGLIAAAGVVRSSGADPYLASTLDGPVGTAAALHAAAALAARGPLPHCGLATLGLFAGIEDQLPPREGEIALPAAPGLGVEPL